MNRADAIGHLVANQGPDLGSEPLSASVAPEAEPGDTALHLACRLGKVDAVRALLRAGVVCAVRNSQGMLALECARYSEGKQAQVESAFVAELLQHVCSGHAARVERLLKGGVKADSMDGSPNQATLLHWAATFGQSREIVRLLCEAGAKVNAQNKAGLTPAHEAAGHGSLETLEALVEFGADLNMKDLMGRTPRDVAKGAVQLYFDENPLTTPSKVVYAIPSTPPASAPPPSGKRNSSSLTVTTPTAVHGPPGRKEDETSRLRRQLEEQTALNESLKGTIDGLLRENGVSDHVTRLQDHVGALTRQLTATTEQRDKLQNLYINGERELERVLREMAAIKGHPAQQQPSSPNHRGNGSNSHGGLSMAELQQQAQQLSDALERERKEGYAAARLHLTYEADLRAEIKALQEQLLHSVGDAAAMRQGDRRSGLLSSIIPW